MTAPASAPEYGEFVYVWNVVGNPYGNAGSTTGVEYTVDIENLISGGYMAIAPGSVPKPYTPPLGSRGVDPLNPALGQWAYVQNNVGTPYGVAGSTVGVEVTTHVKRLVLDGALSFTLPPTSQYDEFPLYSDNTFASLGMVKDLMYAYYGGYDGSEGDYSHLILSQRLRDAIAEQMSITYDPTVQALLDEARDYNADTKIARDDAQGSATLAGQHRDAVATDKSHVDTVRAHVDTVRTHLDEVSSTVESRVTDAENAATTATEKAEESGGYADDSRTHREAAETARDGAVVARQGVEDERAAAEAASAEALRLQGEIEVARDDAWDARRGAEEARDGSETAQSLSETARTGAETARTGAETARTGAETARSDAEQSATDADASATAARESRDEAAAAEQTIVANLDAINAAPGAAADAAVARDAADGHRADAAASAAAAATSRAGSDASATAAAGSETSARTSADRASADLAGAEAARDAASGSESRASASEDAAALSAGQAEDERVLAEDAATRAAMSAGESETSAVRAEDAAAIAESQRWTVRGHWEAGAYEAGDVVLFDEVAYYAESGTSATPPDAPWLPLTPATGGVTHWGELEGIPTEFPPEAHDHAATEVSGDATPALDVSEASVGNLSVAEQFEATKDASRLAGGLGAAVDASNATVSPINPPPPYDTDTLPPMPVGELVSGFLQMSMALYQSDMEGIGIGSGTLVPRDEDGNQVEGLYPMTLDKFAGGMFEFMVPYLWLVGSGQELRTELDGLESGKAEIGHTHDGADISGALTDQVDASEAFVTITHPHSGTFSMALSFLGTGMVDLDSRVVALESVAERVNAAPATWHWSGTTLPTSADQVHAQARVGDFIVAPNLDTDPGWHRITGV